MNHEVGCPILFHWLIREKIQATISSEAPVLDKKHPHLMSEARWWVLVGASRKRKNRHSIKVKADVRVNTDGDAIAALTSGVPGLQSTAPMTSLNMKNLKELAEASKGFLSVLWFLAFHFSLLD